MNEKTDNIKTAQDCCAGQVARWPAPTFPGESETVHILLQTYGIVTQAKPADLMKIPDYEGWLFTRFTLMERLRKVCEARHNDICAHYQGMHEEIQASMAKQIRDLNEELSGLRARLNSESRRANRLESGLFTLREKSKSVAAKRRINQILTDSRV